MTVTYPGQDHVTNALGMARQLLADALTGTALGLPSRGVAILPGEPAWDCDQGWVRAIRVYPSQAAGAAEDGMQRRNSGGPGQYMLEAELGVLRCVHAVEAAGNRIITPTPEQITDDTLNQLADARALRAVLTYLWPKTTQEAPIFPHRKQLLHGDWLPLGPQGKYAGGAIAFRAPILDCAPTVT